MNASAPGHARCGPGAALSRTSPAARKEPGTSADDTSTSPNTDTANAHISASISPSPPHALRPGVRHRGGGGSSRSCRAVAGRASGDGASGSHSPLPEDAAKQQTGPIPLQPRLPLQETGPVAVLVGANMWQICCACDALPDCGWTATWTSPGSKLDPDQGPSAAAAAAPPLEGIAGGGAAPPTPSSRAPCLHASWSL